MPPSPTQTHCLEPNGGASLNSNLLSQLLVKSSFHTDVPPSAAEPRSGGQAKPPIGDVYQPLAGGALKRPVSSQGGKRPSKQVLSKQLGTGSMPCFVTAESLSSLSVQSNLQGAPSRPSAVDESNEELVDARLLTLKQGGWVDGSPTAEAHGLVGGVEASRQKVSLQVATRALPRYLVKLVNQLMRDGKKGAAIGLLTDCLTLFCKRMEEGRPSKLQNGDIRSAILPKPGNGQAPQASRLDRDRGGASWVGGPNRLAAGLRSHPQPIKAQGLLPPSSALSYLSRAISNVEPSLEVRKKKIAGITRQIPSLVSKARGEQLAIRWIVSSARDRVRKRGKGLASCLAEELLDAYYKRGAPRERRDSLHKAAESNRSFLRYRWW